MTVGCVSGIVGDALSDYEYRILTEPNAPKHSHIRNGNMSEYQYYEFLAIDRPLTEDEMTELRALSTRAVITPVSFPNVYNWGNFKGNPDKLMQRYFDAHVYVANWMTAIFMVRLPIEALTRETAKAAAVPYILEIKTTKSHWIITWSLEDSENYDRFGMEDGRGWMARLAPVRDELLRGDLRSLYIGWLPAVAGEMMDDDEMEPLAVSGLGDLTTAQQALAEYLEVDPDVLAGAGMGSPAEQEKEVSRQEMEKWIDALPREEVNLILKQLLEGKRQQAERSVRNWFWVFGAQTYIPSILLINSLAILELSIRMMLSCALPKLSRLILPYHTIF